MKHTEAPWIVKKLKDKGIGVRSRHFEILHPLVNEEGEYKGQIGGYHVVMGDKNCQPGCILSEADAQLIAAAPELLAACEAVLKDDSKVVAAKSSLSVQTVKLVMEAIAKAEGRPKNR